MGRIAAIARRSAGPSASPTANPVGPRNQGVLTVVPNVDPANHVPWLESKRRSRARRAEARKARSRSRRRKTSAIVAAATLTFAAGAALAHDNIGSTSVHEAGSSVSRLQSVLGI